MLHVVKPYYSFTITGEPDEDYRKYLSRRLRESLPEGMDLHQPEMDGAAPLDISVDDSDGDVVAGIAAYTHRNTLYIDMLWVHPSLRSQGIGRKLVAMAEEIALRRGCKQARVQVIHRQEFYAGAGYAVTGKLQSFPHGFTIYAMTKDLIAVSNENIAEQKGPA